MNRPALGSFPPVKWQEWLDTGLMKVRPKGLDNLMTTLCGSSANGEPGANIIKSYLKG